MVNNAYGGGNSCGQISVAKGINLSIDYDGAMTVKFSPCMGIE